MFIIFYIEVQANSSLHTPAERGLCLVAIYIYTSASKQGDFPGEPQVSYAQTGDFPGEPQVSYAQTGNFPGELPCEFSLV